MATSLYGTVKKIGSSQFTFDRIYSTRSEMEAQMQQDGVYHGRYVLISYGEHYTTNNVNDATITINLNNQTSEWRANINSDWIANYNADLQAYHNVYDKTVWQKIFDGTTAKYIMVASLNARAPGLTINEDYYSFNLNTDNNSNYIYYTKIDGNNVVTIHDGAEGINHAPKVSANYPIPRWHETLSNDLIYHLDMPMPLHINLAKEPEYFQEGATHPKVRYEYDLSKDANNYIRWEHILKNNNSNETIGADFNFNVPAIGQAISDAYDALYGIPLLKDENENLILDENGNPQATTGTRPFISEAEDNNGYVNLKQETIDALAQTDYVGLLYILDHIGLRASDGHYLLSSDWSVPVHEFGHIDNKPEIINNISVPTSGPNIGLWTLTVEQQS